MTRNQLIESIIELSQRYRKLTRASMFTDGEQQIFSQVAEDLDELQERAANGDGEPN